MKAENLVFEVEARDQSIAQLHSYCENVASVENESALIDAADKPLHTKERESLQKIVIGLAIKGYGYDPAARRNPTIKDMVVGMASIGLVISDDTLRKFSASARNFYRRIGDRATTEIAEVRRWCGAHEDKNACFVDSLIRSPLPFRPFLIRLNDLISFERIRRPDDEFAQLRRHSGYHSVQIQPE